MTEFDRSGHIRTNAYGTTFWVRGHVVRRDEWRHSVSAAELRKADAISYLQRHLARTISGCYVTPNAKCPVCREPVFFYANSFGSRVFFDELGPAWTKHPCTDNAKRGNNAELEFIQPKARKRGERMELLENARIAGYDGGELYGEGTDRSHLLTVDSVLRDGRNNLVICDCITSNPPARIKFNCNSDAAVFDVGDFISKQGATFSFLCRHTMSVISFRNGDDLSSQVSQSQVNVASKPGQSIIGESPKSSLIKRYHQLDKLSEPERMHFQNSKLSVEELCQQLRPFIKQLSQRRIRRPEAVTPYLNNAGYRTATGALWSIRHVYVILSLLFDKKSQNLKKKPKKRVQSQANRR